MRKSQRRTRRCLRNVVVAWLLASAARAAEVDDRSLNSPPSLLESLWQTFKQTMEMTSSVLSSSRKPSSQTIEPQGASKARAVLSSRRIALVRKTLQDHYTQKLVDSSPHWDKVYEQSSRAREESNMRQERRRPIRWNDGETAESGCYFFSENVGSYWSYQWCQDAIVMQGFRTKENQLNARHLLGSFVPFDPTGALAARDYAQKFAREVHLRYPSAQIELYHNGDPCGKSATGPASRRMTVVLLHEHNSKFCAGDWTDDLTGLAVESVEEPQDCRYLIHVCGAPSSRLQTGQSHHPNARTPITQSDAKKLNQTMTQIQQSLQTYLRESSADAQRKTNPDRTTSLHIGLPPLPKSRIQANLHLVRDMFQHAYDSYMYNAFPASDIKPMTCQPASFDLVRIPGLTLIDSLDTLIVLGNYTEFARAVERLRGLHKHLQEENPVPGGIFALNQNVSVFETNIRVLGGLLSAHQMAEAFLPQKVLKADVWDKDKTILIGITPIDVATQCPVDDDGEGEKMTGDRASLAKECAVVSSLLECQQDANTQQEAPCRNNTLKFWKYDGILLDLAQDIGDRLLPAFSTKTGIPYGTVNLLNGIPRGETTIASLAGGGTLTLEMELLSRLTGNPKYGNAAKLATRALWMRRSKLNLVGKHICTNRGDWTEGLSGIGSNSDSFYEYLMKHYILFPEDYDFWIQLVSTYGGLYNESRVGEWYGDVDFNRGQTNGSPVRRVFEALMAFYPGMQVLLGELTPAARSLNSFFLVREHLGFLPERFNYAFWRVDMGGGHHFLRPELLESAYFMHRASKGFMQTFRNGSDTSHVDASGWQWAADFSLRTLEEMTRTVCGYASLKSVSPTTTGEVIHAQGSSKFSQNMMNEMPSFFLSETLKYLYLIFDETNVLHTDTDRDWVFTTEAHPIHHVDKAPEHLKSNELDKLRERLVEQLEARVQGKTPPRSASRSYQGEKWTEATSSNKYFNQAAPIALEVESIARSRLSDSECASHGPSFWSRSQLVEPLVPASKETLEQDFFFEAQRQENAAHLTFSKLGNGVALTSSCPNFYLPDWRWIRALNGGASDYSDAYVSSAMDKPVSGENHFHMLGSLDALAMYGSKVHVSEIHGLSQKCPIVDRQTQSGKSKASSANDASQPKDAFDMGGELGMFEVSAFPEGSGFLIQRTNTGETLMTTLIQDETSGDPMKTYVMVYATTPVDENDSEAKTDHIGKETVNGRDLMEKYVIMADLEGDSFSCQVEVIHRKKQNTCDDGDMNTCKADFEKTLAVYPCAPALFGPARVDELADADGLIVESSIVRQPDGNGGYGCGRKTSSSKQEGSVSGAYVVSVGPDGSQLQMKPDQPGDYDGSINFVYRGACTFEEKALVQKRQFNARAVVVINSEEDELFVMSGGGSAESETPKASDFPPTVLVTGADGKDLHDVTKSHMELDTEAELVVRISILRDHAQILESNQALSVHNNRFWPAVRATNDVVQIFAKGGWAVHAMQRSKDNKQTEPEWQLYLLRHDSTVGSDEADTL